MQCMAKVSEMYVRHHGTALPSNGVRLMEFDSFLQISVVVETLSFFNTCMFNRATHPPRPSCEHLAEFAWWKIFYFIFRKPIKLSSAVGVRLMGQYKHTNINLTTGMGSD